MTEGNSDKFDHSTLSAAREEAQKSLENQLDVISDIDKKPIKIFRSSSLAMKLIYQKIEVV